MVAQEGACGCSKFEIPVIRGEIPCSLRKIPLFPPKNSLFHCVGNSAASSCTRSCIRRVNRHGRPILQNSLLISLFAGNLDVETGWLYADQYGLMALSVDLPVRPWPILIATLKNRTLSPVVERFIECAHEVAKSLAGRRAKNAQIQVETPAGSIEARARPHGTYVATAAWAATPAVRSIFTVSEDATADVLSVSLEMPSGGISGNQTT